MTAPGASEPIDLEALARQRLAKVRSAIDREGLDVMVVTKSANVRYATGSRPPHGEGSRDTMLAMVAKGRDPISYGGRLLLEDAGGLAERVVDLVPDVRRIALDRLSLPILEALGRLAPRAEIVDADRILGAERMVKLCGEITLLRRAQELNEAAIYAVLDRLRPGIREIDLTAAFHARLGELGVSEVHVESVWCAAPKTRAEAPWTRPGSLPYRELSSERVIEAGDLVVMDTGILFEGYMSDFGRTWFCERPGDAERALFERWREIRDRLLAECRPGNSALDLRRAALRGWSGAEPPWPAALYVAHSIGLGGVEPPFVGTDLGEAVEEQWVLEPGMVIVLEPYVWEEGMGGYRAEETVVITETGCERFTDFPYGPFER